MDRHQLLMVRLGGELVRSVLEIESWEGRCEPASPRGEGAGLGAVRINCGAQTLGHRHLVLRKPAGGTLERGAHTMAQPYHSRPQTLSRLLRRTAFESH
jgi:hypothetical protein